MKANRHPNIHLQRAYNRDGEAAFDYDVLEETDDTIEAEDFWIQYFRGIGAKLYNLAPVAGSCRGIKRKPRTKEWRENQSALMKERMQDESLRNHINDGRQSYWSKEESKEAAAKRMKERMDNPEYKAKVSAFSFVRFLAGDTISWFTPISIRKSSHILASLFILPAPCNY